MKGKEKIGSILDTFSTYSTSESILLKLYYFYFAFRKSFHI